MFARKKYRTTQSALRLWIAFIVLLGGAALAGALTGFASRYYNFDETWICASSLGILVSIFCRLAYEKVSDSKMIPTEEPDSSPQ